MVRPGAMAEMIDDGFANYVVQTALEYADERQRERLIKELIPLLHSIKTRSWYKRITSKMGIANNANTNNAGHYDPRQPVNTRHFADDPMHQRMNSDRGIPAIHGHGYGHQIDRAAVDPSYMHGAAMNAHPDRNGNGYRPSHSTGPSHPQMSQQFGNFYPYTRNPEYRTNGEY
jgi:hypothetical protein